MKVFYEFDIKTVFFSLECPGNKINFKAWWEVRTERLYAYQKTFFSLIIAEQNKEGQ